MRSTLLLAAVAAASAASLGPKPVPSPRRALDSALVLRGGLSRSDVALGLNTFISAAYGVGCTLSPTNVLKIYGGTETIGFLHPAHGVTQYLGGLHIAMALRCAAAMGVAGLPARDRESTLMDQAVVHAAMAAVAAYRTFKGSQISFLAATASPLPGSLILATLSYTAARSLKAA